MGQGHTCSERLHKLKFFCCGNDRRQSLEGVLIQPAVVDLGRIRAVGWRHCCAWQYKWGHFLEPKSFET